MSRTPSGSIAALVLLLAVLPASLAGGPVDGDEPVAASSGGEVPVVLVANSKAGTVQIVNATAPYANERKVDVVPDGKPSASSPDTDRAPDQTANAIFVNEFAGDNFAQDLDISPDGTTLYVSRGHLKDVAAFDLSDPTAPLLWQTTVDGFRADHMTISANGSRLFVSDLTEHQVVVLDTSDGSRIGSFPTGDYAHGVHTVIASGSQDEATAGSETVISTDGACPILPQTPPDERPAECVVHGSIGNIVLHPRRLRNDRPEALDAALNEPYQLTIADADTLEVLRTIAFPDGIRPTELVLEPDEKMMYYQESEFHGIVEYNLTEARERRRVQLPVDENVTEDDYSFESPHHGLAISPDHATLCAAGRASDYAALVNRTTMLPEHIVEVGDAPGWAVTGPNGSTCWIASTGSDAEDPEPGADTVSVISYETGAKLATIDTQAGPKHLLPTSVPASVLS